MIDHAGNTINRHRTSSLTVKIRIQDKMRHRRNRNNTIDRRVLFNKCLRKSRQRFKLLRQMPGIQRSSKSRTELTSNLRWVITILSPSLLIAKNIVIVSSTLTKNLLIKNRLFTKINKPRPIVIPASTTAKHTKQTLLIC